MVENNGIFERELVLVVEEREGMFVGFVVVEVVGVVRVDGVGSVDFSNRVDRRMLERFLFSLLEEDSTYESWFLSWSAERILLFEALLGVNLRPSTSMMLFEVEEIQDMMTTRGICCW